MKNLFDLISNLVKGKFHGELTITFFGGEIRNVKKVQSLDVTEFV